MSCPAQILVHRYGQAFMHVFGDRMHHEDFLACQRAAHHFNTHRSINFFLSLPSLTVTQKKELLYNVCRRFNLPDGCSNLIDILVRDKRSQLLGRILSAIVDLYKEKHGIMSFDIETSVPLKEPKIQAIKTFLARCTGKDILYTYKENKDLIAGIRLQSDTLLWEHSVRKKLRAISLSLMR